MYDMRNLHEVCEVIEEEEEEEKEKESTAKFSPPARQRGHRGVSGHCTCVSVKS